MKRLLAAPLLLLAFSGCMKIREELVVMPDGSGRVSFTFALNPKSETAKFTEQEMMSGDPDEITDKVRGVVALVKPVLEEKDGVVRIRMTAYFDDVNALRFMDDGEGDKAKPKQAFSFRKEGDGFALEVKGNLLADEGAPATQPDEAIDPEVRKQRAQLFQAMFAGFEFRQDVRMPGRVAALDGILVPDGRVASYIVDGKSMQKPSDQGRINSVKRFTISCGKSEVTDAEAAEFRKELEAAKAGWDALKKEMKKNAARK